MLFFRSEEHVDEWRKTWHMPRGVSLTLDQCWRFAQAWYGESRAKLEWRRRTPDEVRALFAELGFAGEFWSI